LASITNSTTVDTPPDVSRRRQDAAAARLWSLGWAVLSGAGLGLALALFADISMTWVAALAIGALPGLLGALWRPTGIARLSLIGLFAIACASSAVLTGGLTGPLAIWCLVPLLASVALGGGVLDGVVFSALALAAAGLGGMVAALPPPARELQAQAFAAIGAASALIAAVSAVMIARRRALVVDRAQSSEIGELQGLLGDLPHLAVALDRADGVYAVFGQPLNVMSHEALYGGLAASAVESERPRVTAALHEALDHGDSEVVYAPAAHPETRVTAALRRTASGGVVAVLRDVTAELAARRAPAPVPAAAPAPVRAFAPPAATPAPAPVHVPAAPTDRTELLSLTARLAETRVKAQEAEHGRERALAEITELRTALAAAQMAAQTAAQTTALATAAPAHPPAPTVDVSAYEEKLAAMTTQIAALEADKAASEARSAKSEETLKARSRFLANMSHELRTPLNAILGFSEVMKTKMFGDLAPKYVEYAELIHESGRHLMDLINDVLDMSKIEAARFTLNLDTFDARDAVNAALRLMRVQAEEAGVNLRGVLPNQPVLIHADRRALKQITLNLVSNALKFTPRGGHVTVNAVALEGLFELAVADTGVGISPEDVKRLGRPFEQAGDMADQARGTGLGLSLVKAFAELHGGDMSIESQLGEGTAVLVRMPVLASAASASDGETAASHHEAAEPAEAAPAAPLHTAQVIPLPPRQS
jgi:signal transduction histidine kinase